MPNKKLCLFCDHNSPTPIKIADANMRAVFYLCKMCEITYIIPRFGYCYKLNQSSLPFKKYYSSRNKTLCELVPEFKEEIKDYIESCSTCEDISDHSD